MSNQLSPSKREGKREREGRGKKKRDNSFPSLDVTTPPPPQKWNWGEKKRGNIKTKVLNLQKKSSPEPSYPTNNTLLINFRLSSDAEILLISTDWADKRAKNVHALCTYSNRAFILHTTVGGWVKLPNPLEQSSHFFPWGGKWGKWKFSPLFLKQKKNPFRLWQENFSYST